MLEKEAMSLLPLFPDSKELNYIAVNHFLREENYLKGFYHQSKVIKAFVEERLYTSPELYFVKHVLSESNDIENISNVLALFYEGNPELQSNENEDFIEDSDLLNGDTLGKAENSEQNPMAHKLKQISNAEALIDEQNKKMGLNLSL